MKRLLLTAISVISLSLTGLQVRAQAVEGHNYKNAIGGRFGVANGITFKTF